MCVLPAFMVFVRANAQSCDTRASRFTRPPQNVPKPTLKPTIPLHGQQTLITGIVIAMFDGHRSLLAQYCAVLSQDPHQGVCLVLLRGSPARYLCPESTVLLKILPCRYSTRTSPEELARLNQKEQRKVPPRIVQARSRLSKVHRPLKLYPTH